MKNLTFIYQQTQLPGNALNKLKLLLRTCIICVFCVCGFAATAQNAANDIVGDYMVPSRDGAIRIYEEHGKYYGKIILNKDAARLDVNNPDKTKRAGKVLGMNILNSFTFDGDDLWENGTIYDPKNGKTYSCKITRNTNGDLNIRGFIGLSLLGRTEVFTRIKK